MKFLLSTGLSVQCWKSKNEKGIWVRQKEESSSNFNVYMSHLGILSSIGSDSGGPGWGLRLHSKEAPAWLANAADVQTQVWITWTTPMWIRTMPSSQCSSMPKTEQNLQVCEMLDSCSFHYLYPFLRKGFQICLSIYCPRSPLQRVLRILSFVHQHAHIKFYEKYVKKQCKKTRFAKSNICKIKRERHAGKICK